MSIDFDLWSAYTESQVISGTLTTQYAYSGDGVRRTQTVNGVETRYVVDVNSPLPQVLEEQRGANVTRYLYGLTQIAVQDSGTWAYQHPDGLGSLRQLSNSAGEVTLARSYTPFGAPKQTIGLVSGSFGYAGEQQDAAADLIFLRARYYDPTTGRFLTRDPYPAYASQPGTLHRYAYARNDPVNLIDPSGLTPERADSVDATNQFTRLLSEGVQVIWCGLRNDSVGRDLGRWLIHEYRTNPFWQQHTPFDDIIQFVQDATQGRTGLDALRSLGRALDQRAGQWLQSQLNDVADAFRHGDYRMAATLMFNFGSNLLMAGLAGASFPVTALVGAGLFIANVGFQHLAYGTDIGADLRVNGIALAAGMLGGVLNPFGGTLGRIVSTALGAGLGQIATNAITGQPWDKGLLLNVGLSLLTEGATAGVARGVGWIADQVNVVKQTLGDKIQSLSGWAAEHVGALTQRTGRAIERFGGWAKGQLETIGGRVREGWEQFKGWAETRIQRALASHQEPIRALALYGQVETPYDPSNPLLAEFGVSEKVIEALYEPLSENSVVAIRHRPAGAERYDLTADYPESGLRMKGDDILPDHIVEKYRHGLRLVEKDGERYWVLSDLDLGGVARNGELLGLRSPDVDTMDRVFMGEYANRVNKALDYRLIKHGGGGIVHPGLEIAMKEGASVTAKIMNERVLVLGIRNGQRFIRTMPYREFLRQYAPKGLPSWALTGDLPTLP